MTLSLLLGAGFSSVAGLPLAKDLFNLAAVPPHKKSEKEAYSSIPLSFKKWSAENKDAGSEEWLHHIYYNPPRDLFGNPDYSFWTSTLYYLLRRLSEVKEASSEPYFYGITRYDCHPIHNEFWNLTKKNELKNIVTLNYDLLVERALNSNVDQEKYLPEFGYGGFPEPYFVEKVIDKRKGSEKVQIQLGDKYLIYKLHGSLNWAFEKHKVNMKCYDDIRSVFRVNDSLGEPAVVPPLPEKELHPRFATIWNQARTELRKSKKLVICGYSFPDYDKMMRKWFKETIINSNVENIAIIDLYPEALEETVRDMIGQKVKITALQGLPGCLTDGTLRVFLEK